MHGIKKSCQLLCFPMLKKRFIEDANGIRWLNPGNGRSRQSIEEKKPGSYIISSWLLWPQRLGFLSEPKFYREKREVRNLNKGQGMNCKLPLLPFQPKTFKSPVKHRLQPPTTQTRAQTGTTRTHQSKNSLSNCQILGLKDLQSPRAWSLEIAWVRLVMFS